jgi:hypothetical protein
MEGAVNESTPSGSKESRRSAMGILLAVAGVVDSVLFLLNLTMGIVEIPDNAPIIGHIDEALAGAVLLSSLRYLGMDLLPFLDRVSRSGDRD